jgi:signal transduction histidine kinase
LQRSASTPPRTPFKGHLLVVDDDENNRDLLCRRLAMEGHTTEEADGGRQALQKIEANRYDLILLDIMMPEINGIEVLTGIRKTFPPGVLPVIMATARDDSHDVAGALRLGANDYVTKPLDMMVLLARIQTQLGLTWYQAESDRLGRLRDEFIQIASHDIKSPLSHILGYGNLLLETEEERDAPNKDILDFSRRIIGAARTTQRLVEDFLDLEVLEDGRLQLERQDSDLSKMLEKVVSNHLPSAKDKRLQLEARLASDIPPISIDPHRIEQVADNLIGNAIKFCPPDKRILVQSSILGGEALVEVSDTGPGLSEDEMERAFTKYARLTPKPTGGETSSGLGLAISKMMIEAHGGRVGVRANESGGACFWFSLPLTPP